MTKAQEIYRKQLLAIIHTHPFYKHAKANEAWGDFLSAWGAESCAKLGIKELINLIAVMDGKEHPKPKDSLFATRSQIYAIESIWQKVAKDTSERALIFFIKKVTKNLYLKVEHLKKKEASKVLIVLKKMENA
ncbi:DUF1018 domain-containing protein [Campylobacter sp. RM9344]|uniref:DUF1018 domain-containing protein n=1 Tax=Campylobacter californiensis TaxID=1032243 RepID=A0AAW3ZTU0_9BACT|nr:MULTISPECIES: phage protein GemA/Gp16 family protein [unclassified Campylobacter]MBE2984665.1 DUF1018 domain-containing protein [Campylobacter sp. RM6883]MBE2994581.1 DUF1018 domain-containing protein [Campylobacter sp. RM6913]MBE3028848.1 DUF1018 domain-containing protein [Campylobacter sp. RM9344]MBE3607206.1 DUF1018 domain-containing protein [Campylobacter sp. RM9337]QCD50392.1 putative DUF1018 domain protein [Campylobacter sp. RM6914]